MMSGTLEMSNLNMTTELAVLIQAQQAFSGSSRLLQAENGYDKTFLQPVRKTITSMGILI